MKLSSLTLLVIGVLLGFSAITAAAEVSAVYHNYTCEMTGELVGNDTIMGPTCLLLGNECERWYPSCSYYCEIKEPKGLNECPAGQTDYRIPCEQLLPDGNGRTPAKQLSVTFYDYDGDVVPSPFFGSERECREYVEGNPIACLSWDHPKIRELAKAHCPARRVTVNSSCAKDPNPVVAPLPVRAAPVLNEPPELL
jgi:hypothetical protein